MKLNPVLALLLLVGVLVFLASTGTITGSACLTNVGCTVADGSGLQLQSWDDAASAQR